MSDDVYALYAVVGENRFKIWERDKMDSDKCIKCGNTDINVKYYEEVDKPWSRRIYECSNTDEHLHKTCRNCQYEWCDPTLDQKG